MATAGFLEVRLFLGFPARGRINFVLQDFARLGAGAITITLPAATYALVYIVTLGHNLAALGMVAVASIELFAVVEFVRKP